MVALVAVEDQQSRDEVLTVLRMCLPDVEVFKARTAAQCIDFVRKQNTDVVILDYYLPDTSGPTLIKEIRQISPVPIVVLSFLHDDADMLSAIESGADEFCYKPIRQLEFAARTRALLRRNKSYPGQASVSSA